MAVGSTAILFRLLDAYWLRDLARVVVKSVVGDVFRDDRVLVVVVGVVGNDGVVVSRVYTLAELMRCISFIAFSVRLSRL